MIDVGWEDNEVRLGIASLLENYANMELEILEEEQVMEEARSEDRHWERGYGNAWT